MSLSHCVAKSVQPPPGVPHVCYCFTPMRYAWEGREAYLEGWSDRPVRRAMAGSLLNRLRDWDRDTSKRVSQFVAISETIRERIAGCYHRDSRVDPAAGRHRLLPPRPRRARARTSTSSSRPSSPTSGSIRRSPPATDRADGWSIIGAGPERPRLERLAGPTVTFLGWQSDEVDPRPLPALSGLALPRRGRLRHRPRRGPRLRGAGDRLGARRRGRDGRRRLRPSLSRPHGRRPPRGDRRLGSRRPSPRSRAGAGSGRTVFAAGLPSKAARRAHGDGDGPRPPRRHPPTPHRDPSAPRFLRRRVQD